jgi:hypothetical protein
VGKLILFLALLGLPAFPQAVGISSHPHSVNTVRNGVGLPANTLGSDGDFYVNTSTWIIYGPKAGTWPSSGFPLGNGDGGSGSSGIRSAAVNGSGHLIVTLLNGDTLDAGAVVGPAGATGAAGAAGAPGATGASGAKGDTGASGTGTGTIDTGTSGQFAQYNGGDGTTVGPHDLGLADFASFLSGTSPDSLVSGVGTFATDHCAKWDANGNLIDSGAACGAGGSAITTPGTTVSGNIVQWNSTTGAALGAGLGLVTTLGSPGSDSNLASEKAVRTAITAAVSGTGTLPAETGTAGYLVTNGSVASWGNIVTGGSGALDCSSTPGECDIVTSVVPLKASANVMTGVNKFSQFQVNTQHVAALTTCNSSIVTQVEGVDDATSIFGALAGSGSVSMLVWCDGSAWKPLNGITSPLPISAGGTGTSSPGIIAGNNTTVTGSFPTQTINAFGDIGTPSNLVAWREALAKSATQVVRVKVFADSISRCVSNVSCSSGTGPADKASLWVNNLRQAITNAGYVSHGTGMLSVITSGVPNVDGTAWTLTGTWTTSTAIGPQQVPSAGTTLNTLVKMSPAATATMSAHSGTTLIVYCARTSDSSSGMDVAIDGTSAGTACGTIAGSATAVATSFTVSAGSHTVVLTAGGTGFSYLYGAEWVANTYGVAIDNYAVGSMQALGYVGHFDFSDLQSGDALTVLSLGTNEAEYGTVGGSPSFATELAAIATHQAGRGSSILLFAEPPCSNLSCSSNQPTAIAAMLSLATSAGYGYISAYTQWPAYADANAMGLFSDGLHPNDAGALALADLVNSNVIGGAATSTEVSKFMNGSLNIMQSATNGGFNPMLNLRSLSSVSGTDVNISYANSSHEYRAGLKKSDSSWYLYDKTNNRYDADWDTGGSAVFTSSVNYAAMYLLNTSTGTSAITATVYKGSGRWFWAGVGNSSETAYGCANKFCIYDLTGGALRASMDSTGVFKLAQGAQIPPLALASWTACATAGEGAIIRVSDSSVTTVGNVIASGGSSHVTGMCDGTNYRVLGAF